MSRRESEQKERGLHIGKAAQKIGVTVNRSPHKKGSVGSRGSSRAATHDRGNKQAIRQGTQKVIQEKFGGSQTRFKQAKSKMNRRIKSQESQESREHMQVRKQKALASKRRAKAFRADNIRIEPRKNHVQRLKTSSSVNQDTSPVPAQESGVRRTKSGMYSGTPNKGFSPWGTQSAWHK